MELNRSDLRTSANNMLMNPPRLAQDIQSQPASLARVLQQQCGPGLPALAQAAKLLCSGKRVLITGMGASMCASPSVPEPLTPLFEIVPVQVAAMRLAQLRGVPLGVFRYVPQVAKDEATLSPG
jgi:glucosamine 6-phosphate synthetase-like amidotransferase/phosphosugar isomerase protein